MAERCAARESILSNATAPVQLACFAMAWLRYGLGITHILCNGMVRIQLAYSEMVQLGYSSSAA